MVLIFSNSQDPTTDRVIEWLFAFGVLHRRINSEDLTDPDRPFFCDPVKGRICLQGERGIDSEHSPIRACWYRRWHRFLIPQGKKEDPLLHQLRWESLREAEKVSRFLFERFKELPWLTDPEKANSEDKLLTLRLASKKGLKVPKSLISNRREQVLEYFKDHDRIITKPLGDPSGFIDQQEGRFYRTFAESLDRASIKELPRTFFPSFFQERVDKSYEVRAFYLDGTIYATALFSPRSRNTDIKIDNGMEKDLTHMSRTELPNGVETRLEALMKELGLNSGSIDLLVRPDGEYVFLEVNPIGQFLGYGERINYALDKHIAEWLFQKDQNHETEKALVP